MESNDDIMRAIGRLEGELQEGFSGIHTRQDITNGRIAKTEDRVSSLETSRAETVGWDKRSAISRNIIWGLIGSLISGGLVYLLSGHIVI
jgi:hypothetical protein